MGVMTLSVVGAALATAAHAANVDYEGEPLGPLLPTTQLVFEGPLYVQANGESEIVDGGACAPNCPDNGTTYHLSHGQGFGGALTISGDDPIDLFSIDVAEPAPGVGSILLLIQPVPAAGGEGAGELLFFDTDGIADGPGGQPDFETLVFPDTWRDLDAVVIVSAAPYLGLGLDNIIVVPEIPPVPSLAPISLGALALALCVSAVWVSRIGD